MAAGAEVNYPKPFSVLGLFEAERCQKRSIFNGSLHHCLLIKNRLPGFPIGLEKVFEPFEDTVPNLDPDLFAFLVTVSDETAEVRASIQDSFCYRCTSPL